MKLLHIIPTFYPATYWGGPIYSVYGLCNALARIPHVKLKVLTTDAAGPSRSNLVKVTSFPMHYSGGYEVYYCSRWWGDSVSPSMFLRLWPMIQRANIVHLTAVYSPPTIPTLLICRLLGKPVVWSPRGALQRWEGATRPLAKRAWEWICNALISRKNCVMHVTSEQEARDSRARISNAETTIIPNGIEFPVTLPARSWLPDGKLRLLYIGRLHPKKGIENLLRAIKLLEDKTISLTICGSGDTVYLLSMRQLVHELGLEQSVGLLGHVGGEEKIKAFMQSDVCIVPSFTENFGMVVAEALAHGVPVIASKGTPWAELDKYDCGLWVDNAPESLAKAISSIRNKALQEMGSRGRVWMNAKYDGTAIAAKMFSVYNALIRM